jgi:hypothetical protein
MAVRQAGQDLGEPTENHFQQCLSLTWLGVSGQQQ